MITRINLIEKEPFKFTYTKIIKGSLIVAGLCAFIYGIQIIRTTLEANKIKELSADITKLKEERRELLKAAPPKLEVGSQSFLNRVFTQTPRWALLIDDIAKRLPGSVWFNNIEASTNFTATPTNSNTNNNNRNNKTQKVASSGGQKLAINGQARNLDELAKFISKLIESPFINQATLTESKKQNLGFTFKLECDMVAANP